MIGFQRRAGSIASGGLAAVLVLATATGGWSQQAPAPKQAIPQFPPGPDFVGVAGSKAEMDRIAALCGANRNATDGFQSTPAFPGQTKAPILKGTQGYAVESVAKVDRPWSLAFLPNGKMIISYRAGGLAIVDKAGVVSAPLAGTPQIVGARLGSGMYDVILDKDFARNRTVYLSYHTRQEGDAEAKGRVASAKLSADEKSLIDLKVLREGADIQPRRIVQAKDGTILILSAGVSDSGTMHQDLKNQLGKVLRINADGSIPKDNPYTAMMEANHAVWALGYRDIHSAVIHPKTGELWVAENTPKGGDELNIMRKGKNYGFPIISYGRENNGSLINGGKTVQAGLEQPAYYWTASIAPSGMTFYDGKAFPAWKGNVFVGAMSGKQLVRLEMKNGKVVAEEKMLMDRCKRVKDVRQGPDGFVYVITDETPSEILRLVPAKGK